MLMVPPQAYLNAFATSPTNHLMVPAGGVLGTSAPFVSSDIDSFYDHTGPNLLQLTSDLPDDVDEKDLSSWLGYIRLDHGRVGCVLGSLFKHINYWPAYFLNRDRTNEISAVLAVRDGDVFATHEVDQTVSFDRDRLLMVKRQVTVRQRQVLSFLAQKGAESLSNEDVLSLLIKDLLTYEAMFGCDGGEFGCWAAPLDDSCGVFENIVSMTHNNYQPHKLLEVPWGELFSGRQALQASFKHFFYMQDAPVPGELVLTMYYGLKQGLFSFSLEMRAPYEEEIPELTEPFTKWFEPSNDPYRDQGVFEKLSVAEKKEALLRGLLRLAALKNDPNTVKMMSKIFYAMGISFCDNPAIIRNQPERFRMKLAQAQGDFELAMALILAGYVVKVGTQLCLNDTSEYGALKTLFAQTHHN